MKLLLVTVFSIAVVAANDQDFHDEPGEASHLLPDGTEVQGGVEGEQKIHGGRVIFVPATQLGENQTSSARSDLALEDQQVKVDDKEMLLGRSNWCKWRGGRCTRPNKFSCEKHGYQESPKGRPYCTSKHRRCCYPARECPKGDGFFTVPGTNQCFKYFTDKGRSWQESQAKCQNESLVLAKPDEPLIVRRHLVRTFGNTEAWIGARGTGSSVNWVRDGTMISRSSSLWWSGSPRSTSTNYRLLLLSTEGEMKSKPTRPYYMYQCSSRSWFALCELVMH